MLTKAEVVPSAPPLPVEPPNTSPVLRGEEGKREEPLLLSVVLGLNPPFPDLILSIFEIGCMWGRAGQGMGTTRGFPRGC